MVFYTGQELQYVFSYTVRLQSRIRVLCKKLLKYNSICIHIDIYSVYIHVWMYMYIKISIINIHIYTNIHAYIYICRICITSSRNEETFWRSLVSILLSSNRQAGKSLTHAVEQFTIVRDTGLHTQMLALLFKRKIFLLLEELHCCICDVMYYVMWSKLWKYVSSLNHWKWKCLLLSLTVALFSSVVDLFLDATLLV